jgi:hypothetical protein
MKKIVLLLAAGIVCVSSHAQLAQKNSVVRLDNASASKAVPTALNTNHALPSQGTKAGKTTNGGQRWYDYTDYLTYSGATISESFSYLWYDKNSQWPSGAATYFTNNLTSYGLLMDLFQSGFNDTNISAYNNVIAVTMADAYTIDSVAVRGLYLRPNTGVSDTLIVSAVYGNGAASSNIHEGFFTGSNDASFLANYNLLSTDTLFCLDPGADSVHMMETNIGGGAPIITKYVLDNTNMYDTLSDGTSFFYIPLSTPLNVPAGNLVSVAVSFRTGANFPSGDTVWVYNSSTDNHYKYNAFRPWITYNGTGGASPTYSFPTYHSPMVDATQGEFKTLPDGSSWATEYVTMYAWSTSNGTAASDYQFPEILMHVACTTCGLTNNTGGHTGAVATVNNNVKVSVSPNPASSEVAINFTSDVTANTVITISNAIGQVVKTAQVGNVNHANVNFNVSDLSNGVYFYSINAGTNRANGQVVIAH